MSEDSSLSDGTEVFSEVSEVALGLVLEGDTVKVHPLKTMLAKDRPKRKLRRFFIELPLFGEYTIKES